MPLTVQYKASGKDFRKMPTLREIYAYYREPVKKTAKKIRKDYYMNRIMKGWSRKSRAKIITRSGFGTLPGGLPGRGVWAAAGTEETGTPLVWLGEGTKRRYRVMSNNYVSKTWYASGLASRSGRGAAAGFNMNEAWAIKHRIKPRYFRIAIVRDARADFHKEVAIATGKMWREKLR